MDHWPFSLPLTCKLFHPDVNVDTDHALLCETQQVVRECQCILKCCNIPCWSGSILCPHFHASSTMFTAFQNQHDGISSSTSVMLCAHIVAKKCSIASFSSLLVVSCKDPPPPIIVALKLVLQQTWATTPFRLR